MINFDEITGILASEIECLIFEKYVSPALKVAEEVVKARAAPPQSGYKEDPFPYQKTFNAIAAATSIEGGHIAISVRKFCETFGEARAAAPQAALTNDARENLLAHADDMDVCGWKDDADNLRSLLQRSLTPFGMLVRALRIVAGTTLMDMANALLTTPARLSAMEFGREQVTQEFAFDVGAYFDALDVPVTFPALDAARKAEIERSDCARGDHGDA